MKLAVSQEGGKGRGSYDPAAKKGNSRTFSYRKRSEAQSSELYPRGGVTNPEERSGCERRTGNEEKTRRGGFWEKNAGPRCTSVAHPKTNRQGKGKPLGRKKNKKKKKEKGQLTRRRKVMNKEKVPYDKNWTKR